MSKYPGQTTSTALLPKILGAIPEHNFYIEGFAGTCQVFKNKKATESLLLDLNEEIVKKSLSTYKLQNYKYECRDTLQFLSSVDIDSYTSVKQVFVFLDPPWRLSNRKNRKLYKYEFDDSDHSLLFDLVNTLHCKIAILHNDDPFYDNGLKNWNKLPMNVSFNGKLTKVALYMNYSLHACKMQNFGKSGINKTDRQRIKRKAERWKRMFMELPVYEQQAIFEKIKTLI